MTPSQLTPFDTKSLKALALCINQIFSDVGITNRITKEMYIEKYKSIQ